MLALLSGAELLGMSLWFTASAVSPQLAEVWGLTSSQAGWLTTMVQLGFVAGTAVAAALNLADVLPERPYFAASAALAALSNAAIAVVPGYGLAVACRFMTGFFLAGVYPPAMKMIATWFRSGRGMAIGTIVGALTIGKATPYLVHAFAQASILFVVSTASAGALAAAVLVLWGYRPGPHAFERRPFAWSLVGTVLAHRPTRLAVYGYLGHMWELYACWSLVAVYFSQFFAARRGGGEVLGSLAGFATIAIGGVGCVVAGAWADRLGRERVAAWAMVVSGACSLVMGWLMAAPAAIVVSLALIWGFAVVADSAQFSALVTEVAPKHAVGTALTLQTSLGFALTAVSISVTIAIAERFGWGPAFSLLAIGPVFGIASMVRLKNVRFGVAPRGVKSGA
jgi:MFS family permease